MTDFRGHIHDYEDVVARGRSLINSVSCSHLHLNRNDDENFAEALQRNVKVCRAKTSRGWRAIDGDRLAERWMISPDIGYCSTNIIKYHTTWHQDYRQLDFVSPV